MKSLKQSFSELKSSTPKHVQWLLLAAAFIVVLILLTLLLRGGKDDKVAISSDTAAALLTVDPDTLDWSEAKVGETLRQRFVVSASGPIKVDDVRLSTEQDDVKQKNTCKNIGQINKELSCTISLEYTPAAPAALGALTLFIDWRDASLPEKMNQTEKIAIAIGANVKKETPEPTAGSAADMTDKPEQESIKSLNDYSDKKDNYDSAGASNSQTSDLQTGSAGEACSDFAFPGYNTSGQQIGWIKPERGRYNFHPFSDRNCNSPTGTYNPDNGLITDASGKKIGTDAEHIGFGFAVGGTIPNLSNPETKRIVNKARQLTDAELMPAGKSARLSDMNPSFVQKSESLMTSSGGQVVSSRPYDRTFLLRQYKPIPATIVSEVRADPKTLHARGLPVRATVDRNVYSDNGRTIIIPTGTMLLGYVTGDMPGPYKTIGRMEIEWYQFIRPDGVEFNFTGNGDNPFSADSQGRVGVLGYGSTDYMEQFIMPMLTSIVPAAVNMIAPISDRFINQIDLDNNTVTQTGQVRSSELAKNEIITAWNRVAQKLMVDMMDNTVPPFSIAAGTRITVFSPMDLLVTCGAPGSNEKKCAIEPFGENSRNTKVHDAKPDYADGSWTGQVRSFNFEQYCDDKGGVQAGKESMIQQAGADYRTVLFYCQANQYKAINNAKQDAVYQNQQQTSLTYTSGDNKGQKLNTEDYNKQVLGLTYNNDGTITNPFEKPVITTPTITCEDSSPPDTNGCCTGETFTDMGEQGFNCCPAGGGDCFPPII